MRIADDLVAHQPAQQLVNRHAQRFALDVPQRDVDGRHGAGQNALRREKAAAEEQLPDVLDPKRVHALQQLGKLLDGPDHRQLAAGDARLAHAIDALVRIDDDKEEIFAPAPNGVGLDVGDFHGGSLVIVLISYCLLLCSFAKTSRYDRQSLSNKQ